MMEGIDINGVHAGFSPTMGKFYGCYFVAIQRVYHGSRAGTWYTLENMIYDRMNKLCKYKYIYMYMYICIRVYIYIGKRLQLCKR